LASRVRLSGFHRVGQNSPWRSVAMVWRRLQHACVHVPTGKLAVLAHRLGTVWAFPLDLALKVQCPGFTTMRRLVLSFRTILRVGKVATLHDWLARSRDRNCSLATTRV
jgi:hypothetical protein